MSNSSDPSGLHLRCALMYAEKFGWHVFPVRPDKHPYTPHGFYDASTDPITITRWWTQFPNASIGLRTGRESGVVALDVDAGHDGFASLDLILAQNGALPATAVSITGGGGRHYIFKHPGEASRCTRGELGPGLDTRGDGGYIILPPSRHESGNVYSWDAPPISVPPAQAPEWLRTFLITSRRPTSPSVIPGNPLASTDTISEGGRNDTLFRMAGIFRAQGMEEEGIVQMLEAVNLARCKPPLPESEINTIARSVCRYERGAPLVEEWDGSGETSLISGGTILVPHGAQIPDESDLGNAQRFVEQHGEDVRYIKSWGRWLLWAGSHWSTADDSQPERLAQQTAQSITDEVRALRTELATLTSQLQEKTQEQLKQLSDSGTLNDLSPMRKKAETLTDEIKYLSKHAKESKSDRSLRAMLRLAGTQSGIDLIASQLDHNPFLLNLANGTLDLNTYEIRAHHRNDLLTRAAPVTYDPNAKCPRWEAFLTEIMQSDRDLVSYLQRAVGYSLTGSVNAQTLFFLYGDGRNGKSTFINTLRQLLGPYAGIGAATVLEEGDRHPTELADFCGRRVVIISETEEGKRLPQAQIKRLTSEESIRARRMREDFWEFNPTHKLWICGNHRPSIPNADLGIWRRIHMIPFRYTIPADVVDADLPNVLATELPGILRWALDGLKAYRASGLAPPQAVLDAVQEYRNDEDVIGQFLYDRCERGPEMTVGSNDLYQAYSMWCETSGYRPLNVKRFKQRLVSAGIEARRASAGVFFFGVRKKSVELKEAGKKKIASS